MFGVLTYFCFNLFFISIAAQDVDELLSVAVIFRHGDRNPDKPYSTDPYLNEPYWPEGFGQLTNEGKLRHYELGKWFRQRYNGFLSEQYTEKEIYVQSTDVDRTLMSASINLAALYPPKGNQVWNDELIWQPIPIHTQKKKQDPLLAMKKPCAKYDDLLDDLYEELAIDKQIEELIEFLSEKTGDKITSLDDIKDLYLTLSIEESFNLTLPEWTEEVYPDVLKSWAIFAGKIPCYNTDLARLKVGQLIREIRKNFKNVATSEPDDDDDDDDDDRYKFLMYSGHETTLSNVLMAINNSQNEIPPFASAIIFELHQKNDWQFVNIFYKNSNDFIALALNNCTFDCDLDVFLKILKTIAIKPSKWKDECDD